ncbi:MAG TPA: ABC transporter permease, partial [Thermoanaerobaculaceae bacterium]|nr:ABC transporter permease [Thermoanaerobaculaceae bacterium]
FAQPDRLVYLSTADPNKHFPGSRTLPLSAPCYRDLQERQRVFAGVAASQPRGYTLTGPGETERVPGLRVTGSFFQVLGAQAALGRVLQPSDEHGSSVVVLSHGLWARRYGGDPAMVGQSVILDGTAHLVVGVMPPGFAWPAEPQVFVPDPPNPEELAGARGTLAFNVVARMQSGISVEQARSSMEKLGQQLQEEFPEAREWSIGTTKLWEFFYGDRRPASRLLLLTGIFVLIIACANLANLMVSRAATRQREMALRAALGGGWKERLRPFLADGFVLSIAGGGLGLLLAGGLSGVLRPYVPPELLRSYGLDLRVLGFTLGVSVMTTLVAGLVPTVLLSRLHLARCLREGDRGASGHSQEWLRSVLVTAQVALTLALLVSFGALWQSLQKLQQAPMGFEADRALAFTVRPDAQQLPEEAQQVAFVRQIVRGLSELPGVTAVGSISATPMSGGASGDFIIPGRERESYAAHYRSTSPGGLEALGMTLLKGRGFGDADCQDRPESVIVSRSLAARCWPGQDPIGKTILKKMYDDVGTTFRIVGVVEDVRHEGPAVDRNLETIYWPAHGVGWGDSCRIVVRADGNPMALIPTIRAFVKRVAPDLPLTGIQTLRSVLNTNLETSRTQATLMGLLAAIALGLAVAGIYGVMAHSVALRTREIGIRKALGGQDRQVVWEIVRRGMVLTALGLGAGVVLTAGLGRVLATQVYGVSATDPLSIALASLAFGLVALAASLIPASRAARMSPVDALRSE